MYAVVEVAGSQVKVQEGDRIRVSRLESEPGEKITLDRVLLVVGDDETRIGAPRVEGATVEASVVSHGKADKVKVFKMKRRKGYRKTLGHRQPYTDLRIESISA